MLTRRGFDPGSPWRGLDDGTRMLDQMRRVLFDDLDRGFGRPSFRAVAPATPRIDLVDAGDALRLYAELPGFTTDDLEITLERNRLTLRGRRETSVPEGYQVRRRERGDLSFARTLGLPCPVDPDAVRAELTNGVLELTLPKAPEAQPRQIPIRDASTATEGGAS